MKPLIKIIFDDLKGAAIRIFIIGAAAGIVVGGIIAIFFYLILRK